MVIEYLWRFSYISHYHQYITQYIAYHHYPNIFPHGNIPYISTGWGPQDSVQLPYKWLNKSMVYGRYNELVNGVYNGL